MDKFVRAGIVTLAGTVALGTAGFAVANASAGSQDKDPAAKREDTSTSWVQSTDLDDDPHDDLGDDGARNASQLASADDSPTHHTVNTTATGPTNNTVNTKDTKNTNTANTKDSVNTNTGNTSPSKNTVNTTTNTSH